MSIDGKLRDVVVKGKQCILELEPYYHRGEWSLCGEIILIIENPTIIPKWNSIIWGNDTHIFIQDEKDQWSYRRDGYLSLFEDFLC